MVAFGSKQLRTLGHCVLLVPWIGAKCYITKFSNKYFIKLYYLLSIGPSLLFLFWLLTMWHLSSGQWISGQSCYVLRICIYDFCCIHWTINKPNNMTINMLTKNDCIGRIFNAMTCEDGSTLSRMIYICWAFAVDFILCIIAFKYICFVVIIFLYC